MSLEAVSKLVEKWRNLEKSRCYFCRTMGIFCSQHQETQNCADELAAALVAEGQGDEEDAGLREAIELLKIDAKNLRKTGLRYDAESARAIELICARAAARSLHKEGAGSALVGLGQELSDSVGAYAVALGRRQDGDSTDDEEIGAAIKRCVAAKRAWDAAARGQRAGQFQRRVE